MGASNIEMRFLALQILWGDKGTQCDADCVTGTWIHAAKLCIHTAVHYCGALFYGGNGDAVAGRTVSRRRSMCWHSGDTATSSGMSYLPAMIFCRKRVHSPRPCFLDSCRLSADTSVYCGENSGGAVSNSMPTLQSGLDAR